MALRLAVLKSVFNTYNTNAYPMVFLFLALIFLLVKNKKEQINLLIYEIFGILLLVTPFVGNKILTIGSVSEANWTMYGILCAVPLTAYAAVQLFGYTRNRKERGMLFVVLIVVLQMGMGFSVTGEHFVLPQANQKIGQAAALVAEQLELAENPYVMAPEELAGDLREYSQDIRVFYDASYEELQKDLNLLQSEATYYGCNYVVLHLKYDNEEQMTENGFENRICVDDYVIYKKSS